LDNLYGSSLARILQASVSSGATPFLVGVTADSLGVTWVGSAGDLGHGIPATLDTVFQIVSLSKPIGVAAAGILVDQGSLSLDTPVDAILPRFADLLRLTGFDGDQPRLEPQREHVTVRQLATHTSGLAYEFWDADVARYLAATGQPSIITGRHAALPYPLVFEPGQRWQYGPGIDWLGLVVEAVDGRRIDRFCHEEILGPLGMRDTRFELDGSMAARLAPVKAKTEAGIIDAERSMPSQPEFYGMGHALYSTATDYIRFLRMLLNRGELDGVRVLSESFVHEMSVNQIGDLRIERFDSLFPFAVADLELFPQVPVTQTLGFARLEEGIAGRRSAGSLFWGGVMNTHFWIDPAQDMAGVLMTQMYPFLDEGFMDTLERFERAAYASRNPFDPAFP
jgi:CubicO group peptidase (beta-lactamase class C family)